MAAKKTMKKNTSKKSSETSLRGMEGEINLLNFIDVPEETVVPDSRLPAEPEKPKTVSMVQRRLNYLFARKMEQEKSRLIEKYFGKKSATGIFHKFLEETPSSKKINIELKVSMTT